MACCAFAVFLIGQLYGFVAAIRGWLGWGSVRSVPINAAVSWRAGVEPMPVQAGSRKQGRAMAIRLLSFAALGVGIAALFIGGPADNADHLLHLLTDPTSLCGPTLN